MSVRPINLQIKKLRSRFRTTAENKTVVIPYVGPIDELKAKEPPCGQPMTGFPSEYLVTEVVITEGASINGRMEVTLERPQPGTPQGADVEQLAEPVYELDWQEENLPIEQHKKCGSLKSDRPWYKYPATGAGSDGNEQYDAAAPGSNQKGRQRTWANWEALTDADYEPAGGGWTLAQYKALKEDGKDDFPLAYPVAQVTSYHRFRPTSSGGVWAVGAPHALCGAPTTGWTYVKTSDRITKHGRLYTRVQQWRGFNSTSTLFFL